jgi:hypothetical protein
MLSLAQSFASLPYKPQAFNLRKHSLPLYCANKAEFQTHMHGLNIVSCVQRVMNDL